MPPAHAPTSQSTIAVFWYVNPRTKKRETATREVAPERAGTPGPPDDKSAVTIERERPRGTRVRQSAE